MICVRPGRERGHVDHGWLDTRHTFSFAGYHDPRHMGFRILRVINEDRVGAGQGFGAHDHRDMEILTHVRSGALEHRDSLGQRVVLGAGQWQRMTAGRGITHSEANASTSEPVHFYQVWLFPERRGLEPSYEQTEAARRPEPGEWVRVAAPGGRDALLAIQQDVMVLHGAADAAHPLIHANGDGRHAWLQVLEGTLTVGGHELSAGDGAAISDEATLDLRTATRVEVLLFDLP